MAAVAAALPPASPGGDVLAFLTERHLATLSTVRPDGTPHVVPVGFTYEPERSLARVITFAGARKARNIAARPEAAVALCQLDGARWVTLEGHAQVRTDPAAVDEAVRRYAARYRPPKRRIDRVCIEIVVYRLLAAAGLAPPETARGLT